MLTLLSTLLLNQDSKEAGHGLLAKLVEDPTIVALVAVLVVVAAWSLRRSSRGGSSSSAGGSSSSTNVFGAIPVSSALSTREYRPFQLRERVEVNHNVRRYTFSLPKENANDMLGLPIGKHLSFRAQTKYDEKPVIRSYTPISPHDAVGEFTLLVKVYEQGRMSRHFDDLAVGDSVEVLGPKGRFEYKPNMFTALNLIAGGTGITPMFQILQYICNNPDDETNVSLIYANVAEEDILLREELDTLQAKHDNVRVYYTLDKPPADWRYGKGFISTDMISSKMEAPGKGTFFTACGPPPMMKAMERNFEALGVDKESYFLY